MKLFGTSRLYWILWVGVVAAFVMVAVVVPVSYRLTRAAGLGLFLVVWVGLVALTWRVRFLRITLLVITAVCAGFLSLPARSLPAPALLRDDYLSALRRYEGVRYYWGGESRTGIDCSGLVRRGLIESLFLRGVRTVDAGLVRRAFSLWWNDCTAQALGEGRNAVTEQVVDAESINKLDHSQVRPGDLAVTHNGVHIMAYLGGNQWIEADPEAARVIVVSVPVSGNPWFETRMRIVRWGLLR